jgi:hypothetical protein
MSEFQNNFPNAVRPSPAANQEPEPITRSFIRQFATDITRGKYRDREAEMNAIQAKINRALIAGKILDQ